MLNSARMACLAVVVVTQMAGCTSDGKPVAGEPDSAVSDAPVSGRAGQAGSGGGPADAAVGREPDARQATDSAAGREPDASSAADSAASAATKLTASIVMRDVAPGAEDHVCVVVELSNAEPVWVSQLHATLARGSHHLIVDRNEGQPLQTLPKTCGPTMGSDATRLMIAQQPDTRVQLPSGVAYRFDAHQHVFLQLHYINTTTAQLTIEGVVEFAPLALSSGTPKEAHSLFAGATTFEIPPHMPGMASFFRQPGKPARGARHVFALTSHTHSLGVHATIERVASSDAPPTTPLHESLDWAEPPLSMFDPALEFTGSDGLRLICHYMNDTDHSVHFGTAFNDEMCFLWLYYYDE